MPPQIISAETVSRATKMRDEQGISWERIGEYFHVASKKIAWECYREKSRARRESGEIPQVQRPIMSGLPVVWGNDVEEYIRKRRDEMAPALQIGAEIGAYDGLMTDIMKKMGLPKLENRSVERIKPAKSYGRVVRVRRSAPENVGSENVGPGDDEITTHLGQRDSLPPFHPVSWEAIADYGHAMMARKLAEDGEQIRNAA